MVATAAEEMTEADKVLEVICEVGCQRLANFEDVDCCGFSIRNVEIEICFGKTSERAIWVNSDSLDYWDGLSKEDDEHYKDLLRPIMDEVVRQVQAFDGHGPIQQYFRRR